MSNNTNTCYAHTALKNIHSQLNLKHFNHKLVFGKFNILYLNINSLLNKLDELEFRLYELNNKNTNKTRVQ